MNKKIIQMMKPVSVAALLAVPCLIGNSDPVYSGTAPCYPVSGGFYCCAPQPLNIDPTKVQAICDDVCKFAGMTYDSSVTWMSPDHSCDTDQHTNLGSCPCK